MSNKFGPKSDFISVAKLDFDPHNPRFSTEIAGGPEGELVERFIRDERLLEVLNSIADQGYFAGEPLLVVESAGTDRFHVIEGNRRLAALKLLNGLVDVPPGRSSIEEACEQARNFILHIRSQPQAAPHLFHPGRHLGTHGERPHSRVVSPGHLLVAST